MHLFRTEDPENRRTRSVRFHDGDHQLHRQIMCNATLQVYGGDLYVGVMTVINSIREIATLPVTGVTHSAQPVLGFNYGAKEYGRVKKAIVFTSLLQFYIRPVSG